ncbi:MAG TPA: Crp/Fnr family transcriptional regulator [Tepidisphaeraceae bacterium]|nr:Crp/Fnr family transcriptional regulator [Tepidisphaeraceae bacterium]
MFQESHIRHVLTDPTLGAVRKSLPPGQVLCEAQDPAEKLFFIEEGQVRVYQVGPNQASRLIEILGPEDWFGVSALAEHAEYGSRVIAVGPVTILEVPAKAMLERLAAHPDAAVELVKQLATKHASMTAEASEMVFDDCNGRLIKTLLRFSNSAAATPIDDDSVVLRITHEQLAQAIGAARETISLALTELRKQNLLRTGRNQLFFNPSILKKFAEGNGPDGN